MHDAIDLKNPSRPIRVGVILTASSVLRVTTPIAMR